MPEHPDAFPLLHRLNALSDVARLRILRLLDKEELSVGELASALQLPQSTVSRHLKLLHDSHWITKRPAGTASLYRLADASLAPPMRELWHLARSQLNPSPTLDQDDSRLAHVLAQRRTDSKAFFGQLASQPGAWDNLRRELFGESFTAEALLALVPSHYTLADLGCGTGNASQLLAPHVKKIIAIDREPAMLHAARARLANYSNIDFRQGDLLHPPLTPNEIDVGLMMLVLMYIESPVPMLAQLLPALRPGGFLLIVDLIAHDRTSYLHTLGHRHLGFTEKQIKSWSKAAGFAAADYRLLPPNLAAKGPPLFAALLRR